MSNTINWFISWIDLLIVSDWNVWLPKLIDENRDMLKGLVHNSFLLLGTRLCFYVPEFCFLVNWVIFFPLVHFFKNIIHDRRD